MSVTQAIGYTTDQIDQMIRGHWEGWAEIVPDLDLVPDPLQLKRWLTSADRRDADRILRGLAQLASINGADSIEAAAVLAWLLVPVASLVAHHLGALHQDIDQLVAGQLWIEVRTYPWQTTGRVAANVRFKVRKQLLKDLGATLPMWLPLDEVRSSISDPERHSSEILEILIDGLEAEVISQDDFDLLLAVLDAAERIPIQPFTGLRLTGNRVSEAVASELAVTGRTVRRQTTGSIRALAEFAAERRPRRTA
jgi:hypothetical protein